MSLSVDVMDGHKRLHCLKQQATQTCIQRNWSGLIHMMALSSIVGIPIFSVYPELNLAIRPLFHGLINPRGKKRGDGVLHIMFTRDGNLDNNKGTAFQPNHFCPIFPSQNDTIFTEFDFPPLVPSSTGKKQKRKPLPQKKRKQEMKKCSIPRASVYIDLDSDENSKDKDDDGVDNSSLASPSCASVPLVNLDSDENSKDKDDFFYVSMQSLSRSWYNTRGNQLELRNTNDENGNLKSLLSLPLVSRKWYRARGNKTARPATNVPNKDVGRGIAINKKHEEENLRYHDKPEDVQIAMNAVTKNWLGKRGRLAAKNWSRTAETNKHSRNGGNGFQFGIAKGTLEKNINDIVTEMSIKTGSKRTAELSGLLAVGNFIKSSAVIAVQEAGKVYVAAKQESEGIFSEKPRAMPSSYLFSYFGRYFNIVQFYLNGKSYIMENRNQTFEVVIEQLQKLSIDSQYSMNNDIDQKIGGIFNKSLEMMDTKRDRDILKGIFAHATSVNFVSKLQGVKNKTAVMNCRDELKGNISKFLDIKITSQCVRNDMTNSQQSRLQKRIIKARKDKEMKLNIESRGRMMKCEEWPELASVLEYVFGEADQRENSGGGLEAHPRLKNDVLFRSKDNNTFMRQALEVINAVSPPSFHISLSTCFNYTMTYKKNSASALRHHHGKEVNAKISLHHQSKTLVNKLVVNLHYSTANVNYICDLSDKRKDNVLIDSKDAKKIVCGEITPVQKPGKAWKTIECPDHDWNQSRTDAVTPMTHLFMKTLITKRESIPSSLTVNDLHLNLHSSNTLLHVTRTGKAVTLLNPSLLEPDTTIKLFNELFLLMSKPSLDCVFRDPSKGSLKTIFVFIVDNGPAEQPASPLVQMLLVRLLRLLNLDKITQVSFAEYHSKRNFVERVHAIEDEALSRHGPFSAHKVYQGQVDPGSNKHKENMEAMTNDVISCLSQAKYGGEALEAYRGIRSSEYIFNDEERLKNFLSLSEENKEECDWSYKVIEESWVWKDIELIWNLKQENISGNYLDDYQMINNNYTQFRTAWVDKYEATFYRPNEQWRGEALPRKEMQPIPDYMRWLATGGELHYLSFDRNQIICGPWDESPGLFRPERLLDIMSAMNCDPPESVFPAISFLVWLPEKEVARYFQEEGKRISTEVIEDQERERWRRHKRFSKNVATLRDVCKKMGLSTKGQKHHLVERIATSEGDEPPLKEQIYNGHFQTVPSSIPRLRKLPVAKLRYILHYHGLPTQGNKEELCLRIFLLRQNRYQLAFKSHEDEIRRMLSLIPKIILEERRMAILNPTDKFKKRTHSSNIKDKSFLPVPDSVDINNIHLEMLRPLYDYLSILKESRRQKCETLQAKPLFNQDMPEPEAPDHEQFFVVGKKVKVKWSREEIGDSGWKVGWYSAAVQGFSIENDTIDIVYFAEEESVYTICISEYLSKGKLMPVQK